MKRLALLLVILTIFFSLSFYVKAQELRREEKASVATNEVINHDLFVGGESVSISGTVNGDVYVGGGNVTIDGTVNGDVLGGGGNMTISGVVADDVRVGGGQVDISGQVGGSVTVGGGNVALSETATVGESVVAGGGNVVINAPVANGVTVGGGQVTIGNSVGGDVLAGSEELTLGPKANIGGNLTYYSKNKATLQKGAIVAGETVRHEVKTGDERESRDTLKNTTGIFTGFQIFSFLAALLFGALFFKLAPVFLKQTANLVESKFWASLGLGFAMLFLGPIAIVLLMITVIGIPLATLGIVGYIFYIYLSKIFVAYWLGEKVMKQRSAKGVSFVALLVGLAIYYAVGLVPVVGWILHFVAILVGIGALAQSKRISYLSLRSKKLL